MISKTSYRSFVDGDLVRAIRKHRCLIYICNIDGQYILVICLSFPEGGSVSDRGSVGLWVYFHIWEEFYRVYRLILKIELCIMRQHNRVIFPC